MKKFLLGLITAPIWIVLIVISIPLYIIYKVCEAGFDIVNDVGEMSSELIEVIRDRNKR